MSPDLSLRFPPSRLLPATIKRMQKWKEKKIISHLALGFFLFVWESAFGKECQNRIPDDRSPTISRRKRKWIFFKKKMETIEFFSTSLSPEIQVLIERFFPPSPQNGTRFGQTMGWLGKRKLSRRREKFPLVVYIYAFQSISIFHKESPW